MSTPMETIALACVAQHAADHALALTGIDTPVVPGDPITVNVRRQQLDEWLATVRRVGLPDIRPIADSNHVTLRYPVLVPSAIGDVRAVLLTLCPADELVQALGAAS